MPFNRVRASTYSLRASINTIPTTWSGYMAANRRTFLPASEWPSGRKITIVDRPALQYVVDEAHEAGIEHIVFVTGRNKADTAARYGADQVKVWRRSYDIPPPPLAAPENSGPAWGSLVAWPSLAIAQSPTPPKPAVTDVHGGSGTPPARAAGGDPGQRGIRVSAAFESAPAPRRRVSTFAVAASATAIWAPRRGFR